jgi:Secretion system C-terminal sorting domain
MKTTLFYVLLLIQLGINHNASAQSCARSTTMIVTIKANCPTTPVVDEGEAKTTHSIYPNPTCGDVTVSGVYQQQIRNIAVYNMLGKQVLKIPIIALPHTFSMENMPSGVYLLTIGNDKYVKAVRLVKENYP